MIWRPSGGPTDRDLLTINQIVKYTYEELNQFLRKTSSSYYPCNPAAMSVSNIFKTSTTVDLSHQHRLVISSKTRLSTEWDHGRSLFERLSKLDETFIPI